MFFEIQKETVIDVISVVSGILTIICFVITVIDLINRPHIKKTVVMNSYPPKLSSNLNSRFALIKYSIRSGFQFGLGFGIMCTISFLTFFMIAEEIYFDFFQKLGIDFLILFLAGVSIFCGLLAGISVYGSYRKYYSVCDEMLMKHSIIFESPAWTIGFNKCCGWLFVTENEIIYTYVKNGKIDNMILISDINSIIALNRHKLLIATSKKETLKYYVANSAYKWTNIVIGLMNLKSIIIPVKTI